MIIQVLKKKAKYYWVLKSRNGKTFAHSEQFESKSNAKRSAKSVHKSLCKQRFIVLQTLD